MRTDAQIDKRRVYCPNSTTIGYSRSKAQHGDFVVWNDAGHYRLARVIGRVAYAPELGSKENGTYTPTIRNHLMLAVLNGSASSIYLRWAPPEEIVECYTPADYQARMARVTSLFLSNEFVACSPQQTIDQFAGGFA